MVIWFLFVESILTQWAPEPTYQPGPGPNTDTDWWRPVWQQGITFTEVLYGRPQPELWIRGRWIRGRWGQKRLWIGERASGRLVISRVEKQHLYQEYSHIYESVIVGTTRRQTKTVLMSYIWFLMSFNDVHLNGVNRTICLSETWNLNSDCEQLKFFLWV